MLGKYLLNEFCFVERHEFCFDLEQLNQGCLTRAASAQPPFESSDAMVMSDLNGRPSPIWEAKINTPVSPKQSLERDFLV